MAFVNRHRSDFCEAVRVLLSIAMFCFVLSWSQPALSQHKTPMRTAHVPKAARSETGAEVAHGSEFNIPEIVGVNPISQMLSLEATEEPVVMELTLDWTRYQIHRANDSAPIEITLSGNIFCSHNLSWNLWSTSRRAEGTPGLHFIGNALGRAGPDVGMDIPLTWEVALGDGPFSPMTILPDNTLRVIFPAGLYAFRVRITSPPLSYPQDGYYRLELAQDIIPELR